jgi:hypothetical protein
MTTTDKVDTHKINLYAIPRPPDRGFVRQLELLQSAASRVDWLPEKEPEELARLRPKHLNLVAQVASAQRALLEAERKFREDDEERNKALQNAYEQGRPPADLQPVPQAEREATTKALTERLWAAVVALTEFVESIILTVQANEDMLLKALREERRHRHREHRDQRGRGRPHAVRHRAGDRGGARGGQGFRAARPTWATREEGALRDEDEALDDFLGRHMPPPAEWREMG